MKHLFLLFCLCFVVGCQPKEKELEYNIIDVNGDRYVLIEEAVKPSEENNWIGNVAVYKKDGDNTRYIMVSEGPPPVFTDTHKPFKQ